MKKIRWIVFIVLFIASGCMSKELIYNGNLGYDFYNVKYDSLIFNIYHSNTVNHKWELLKSFEINRLDASHFVDVKLENSGNSIKIVLSDNYKIDNNTSVIYKSNILDTFETEVTGFVGETNNFQKYEIKDINQKQFYALYPISNKIEVSYFYPVDLNKPYDKGNINLDNILITIDIK